jgi:hypothetical protein
MIEGKLIYDHTMGRLNIVNDDGTEHCGLHGGTVIEVKTAPGIWVSARVEMDVDDDWYLVGLYGPGKIPRGTIARFPR